uniref:Paxillin n=1 Tax=Eptatretus burgeri TaxID=7764 RepID=A0A8C4WZS7_EPTBU
MSSKLDNNLTELDRLLQELNAAQFNPPLGNSAVPSQAQSGVTELEMLGSHISGSSGTNDQYKPDSSCDVHLNPTAVPGPHCPQPIRVSASSATRELDELMASLSDFKIHANHFPDLSFESISDQPLKLQLEYPHADNFPALALTTTPLSGFPPISLPSSSNIALERDPQAVFANGDSFMPHSVTNGRDSVFSFPYSFTPEPALHIEEEYPSVYGQKTDVDSPAMTSRLSDLIIELRTSGYDRSGGVTRADGCETLDMTREDGNSAKNGKLFIAENEVLKDFLQPGEDFFQNLSLNLSRNEPQPREVNKLNEELREDASVVPRKRKTTESTECAAQDLAGTSAYNLPRETDGLILEHNNSGVTRDNFVSEILPDVFPVVKYSLSSFQNQTGLTENAKQLQEVSHLGKPDTNGPVSRTLVRDSGGNEPSASKVQNWKGVPLDHVRIKGMLEPSVMSAEVDSYSDKNRIPTTDIPKASRVLRTLKIPPTIPPARPSMSGHSPVEISAFPLALAPESIDKCSAARQIKFVIKKTRETSNIHPMYREFPARRRFGPMILNKTAKQDQVIKELQNRLGISRPVQEEPIRKVQDDWLTEGVVLISEPVRKTQTKELRSTVTPVSEKELPHIHSSLSADLYVPPPQSFPLPPPPPPPPKLLPSPLLVKKASVPPSLLSPLHLQKSFVPSQRPPPTSASAARGMQKHRTSTPQATRCPEVAAPAEEPKCLPPHHQLTRPVALGKASIGCQTDVPLLSSMQVRPPAQEVTVTHEPSPLAQYSTVQKPSGLAQKPASPPGDVSGSRQAPPMSSSQLDSMLGSLQSDLNRQGVAIVAKGTCSACRKPIAGQVVTAMGKTWHPEHFVCTHCQEEIGSRSFFEKDGEPYCQTDYHNLFAPRCAYCNGPVIDKVVTALNRTWHPEHFFCAQCGRAFGEEGFHEKDGKPFCEKDFFEMFAPKCSGCSQPIMENYLSALNTVWHPGCFVCRECYTPFINGCFFELDAQPYCELHYHARRGSLCAGCQKPITGRCISAMGHKFHPEHFTCAFCTKQLNKGTFKEQNDKPYCHPCFVKLFG